MKYLKGDIVSYEGEDWVITHVWDNMGYRVWYDLIEKDGQFAPEFNRIQMSVPHCELTKFEQKS
jgi:hypothetical protein